MKTSEETIPIVLAGQHYAVLSHDEVRALSEAADEQNYFEENTFEIIRGTSGTLYLRQPRGRLHRLTP